MQPLVALGADQGQSLDGVGLDHLLLLELAHDLGVLLPKGLGLLHDDELVVTLQRHVGCHLPSNIKK